MIAQVGFEEALKLIGEPMRNSEAFLERCKSSPVYLLELDGEWSGFSRYGLYAKLKAELCILKTVSPKIANSINGLLEYGLTDEQIQEVVDFLDGKIVLVRI